MLDEFKIGIRQQCRIFGSVQTRMVERITSIRAHGFATANLTLNIKIAAGAPCRAALDYTSKKLRPSQPDEIIGISAWYSWVGSNHRPPVPQTGALTN
jgi:hypothetical protein